METNSSNPVTMNDQQMLVLWGLGSFGVVFTLLLVGGLVCSKFQPTKNAGRILLRTSAGLFAAFVLTAGVLGVISNINEKNRQKDYSKQLEREHEENLKIREENKRISANERKKAEQKAEAEKQERTRQNLLHGPDFGPEFLRKDGKSQ